MRYLQCLSHIRSVASKRRSKAPPFSNSASIDCSNSNELAVSNELLNLISTTSAIDMETALDKVHPFLNGEIVYLLLKEQPDPHLAFRFFIWTTRYKRLRRRKSTKSISNRLVNSIDSSKEDPNSNDRAFDLYWSILDEHRERNVAVNSVAFQVLIAAYSKVNQADKAVETFGKMKEFHCKPNLNTYNLVLRVMIEKEVTLLALAVFNMMLKSNCQPNCSTFNILINGLCKSEKMQDALKMFDEMSGRGISPNKMTYSVVLAGLCRAKRVDDAYMLFQTMRSTGCEPDIIIYNILVNGFCRMGRIDQAFSFSKSFREAGYIMDLCWYTTLINGLVNANRTDESLTLFWKLIKLGIRPGVVLYSIMIRGLCKLRRLKDALNLMNYMIGRGLVPDTPCYNTLIKGFCDMGLLDKARSLYLEIFKNGCFPNSHTYTILISGMCKNGQVGEAQLIFNQMEKFGCSASFQTCNALIHGLCKAGRLEEAHLMFYKMEIGKNPLVFLRLSQGPNRVLDDKSLQVMVEKLCESGLVLKAYKLLTQLADNGVVPDTYTYNILINGFCKVGKIDGALKLYEELHCKGHSADLVTFVTLIDHLQRVGREEDAIKFYEQMRKTKYSCFPEAHIVVMKWCCRRGETSFAFSLWLKYQKSLEGGQDDETLKLVDKLIERGDMIMAFRVLLEGDIKLKHMDPKPYNIILVGLCQARRTKEAMELFSILEEFSTYISPSSCVMLISYLLKVKNMDHAVDVFLYTLEKRFHLMPRVCNNLIRSLLGCQERATDAFHLLEKMKSVGYDLNAYLDNSTRLFLYKTLEYKVN